MFTFLSRTSYVSFKKYLLAEQANFLLRSWISWRDYLNLLFNYIKDCVVQLQIKKKNNLVTKNIYIYIYTNKPRQNKLTFIVVILITSRSNDNKKMTKMTWRERRLFFCKSQICNTCVKIKKNIHSLKYFIIYFPTLNKTKS